MSKGTIIPVPIDIHLNHVRENTLVILSIRGTATQRFAINVNVLDGCDLCVEARHVDVGACVAECAAFYLKRYCDGGT